MEVKVWDIIIIILSVLSLLWAYISQEFRILAVALSFLLMIIFIVSIQNSNITKTAIKQRKLEEKLNIHEQLIDMKSDIKNLKKKVFNK